MNKEQKPEAHRLAEKLRNAYDFADDIDPNDLKLAAMELESLHTRVQELEGRTMQTNKTVSGDGWKLVPVEATPEMVDAYYRHNGAGAAADWSAMVNAAPKPQAVIDAVLKDLVRECEELKQQTITYARDVELLDWLEGEVCDSYTGVTINRINHREAGMVIARGFRLRRFHKDYEVKPTLRAAIAAAKEKP